jgi:polyhydroxyalkanoate synthesis regulator phasin
MTLDDERFLAAAIAAELEPLRREVSALQRRGLRPQDLAQIARGMAAPLRQYVERELAPLRRRIAQLEQERKP